MAILYKLSKNPSNASVVWGIITDYLQQVREGALTTVFREEDRMLTLGLRGRRYSGYKATRSPRSKVSLRLV